MTQDDLRSPKIPQNYAYTANSSGKRFIDFTNRHELNKPLFSFAQSSTKMRSWSL